MKYKIKLVCNNISVDIANWCVLSLTPRLVVAQLRGPQWHILLYCIIAVSLNSHWKYNLPNLLKKSIIDIVYISIAIIYINYRYREYMSLCHDIQYAGPFFQSQKGLYYKYL